MADLLQAQTALSHFEPLMFTTIMQPDTSQTHLQVSGIHVRPNSSAKQFTNIPSISHGDQVMATTSMYLMIYF